MKREHFDPYFNVNHFRTEVDCSREVQSALDPIYPEMDDSFPPIIISYLQFQLLNNVLHRPTTALIQRMSCH